MTREGHKKQKLRDPEGNNDLFIGDNVRHMEEIKVFDKSYKSGWSQDISPVVRIKDSVPRQYFIGSSTKAFYRNELSKVTNFDENQDKNYFIAQTRKVSGRQTRSGSKSGQEIEYLLKSRQDPSISHYISESEKNKLEKLGQLTPLE